MKKFLPAILMILTISSLMADTIHLKDKSAIQGKVLRVTESKIEYDPEGEVPFDVIDRKKVTKIVYSNGREVILSDAKSAKKEPAVPPETIPLYFDLTWGWNNAVGLGLLADYHLWNLFTVNAGLGASLWMYRFTAGLRVFPAYPFKFALAGGVYYSTGTPSLWLSNSSPADGKFEVKLNPVATAYASIIYFFQMENNKRFFVELGYAKGISKRPYFEVTNGIADDESLKAVEILEPEGVLLSIGLSVPI